MQFLKLPAASMITLAASSALMGACTDPAQDLPETQEIIDNLQQAGFPADDIMIVDGAVYVGRDAVVSLAASREMLETAGASEEQYRTNNLIGSWITKICVNAPAFTGVFSTALDLAIRNFDELPLTFSMARAPSSGCNFTINAVISPNLNGGSAGFPSNGLPYHQIIIGGLVSQFGVDTLEHVITHELGHTIGFRHSDYYNRGISCGSGPNEGGGSVGAIHIPGTPTTASVGGSIMNSCFRASETGELTGSDVTAMLALYRLPQTTISFGTSTGHYLVAEAGGGSYMAADRTTIGTWERFVIDDLNGGTLLDGDLITLRASNGAFVVAEDGGGGVVNADRSGVGPWETFRIVNLDGASSFTSGSHVALQASNGQYVVAEGGGGQSGAGSVNANRSGVGPWETFVITLM